MRRNDEYWIEGRFVYPRRDRRDHSDFLGISVLMDALTKREMVILKEALQLVLDKYRDYNHEREKLLSKIEGAESITVVPKALAGH